MDNTIETILKGTAQEILEVIEEDFKEVKGTPGENIPLKNKRNLSRAYTFLAYAKKQTTQEQADELGLSKMTVVSINTQRLERIKKYSYRTIIAALERYIDSPEKTS